MSRIKTSARFICSLSALLGSFAFASDGVLEINHTCAAGPGCFSGDSAGYPVEIDGSAGRNYQLTSDLIVPDEDTDGIRVVNAPSISIDLKGFEIVRSGCEGEMTNCTPVSGSGSGVLSTAASNFGLSVRNGSITGMGNRGVSLGDQGEARNLRVRWNRQRGIDAGPGSIIRDNLVFENGDIGIVALAGSIVTGNVSRGNGGVGIGADVGSVVRGNSSNENGLPDNCGGGICSEKKRYYLTLTSHPGNEVLNACQVGFHTATLDEIHNTSKLQYDYQRGRTKTDSGRGAPWRRHGWVRSGLDTSKDYNCNNWASSDVSDAGVQAELPEPLDWNDPATQISPWTRLLRPCNESEPVWCVED